MCACVSPGTFSVKSFSLVVGDNAQQVSSPSPNELASAILECATSLISISISSNLQFNNNRMATH